MQLSKRLHAVAHLAIGAEKMADVGTDHGYIPIYLVEEGYVRHAIAMDVNQGPLLRAKEHIALHHLEEHIETRLSDGVEKLLPGEADTVVIAGMGGALTIEILGKGREVLSTVDTLVLQPQSELQLVRSFLHQNGYAIDEEEMVLDEGKYYPMMKVHHGIQEKWEAYEYRYGKKLIEKGHPVLKKFLEKEQVSYESIREHLRKKEGEHIRNRLLEVEAELEMIRKAKEHMA